MPLRSAESNLSFPSNLHRLDAELSAKAPKLPIPAGFESGLDMRALRAEQLVATEIADEAPDSSKAWTIARRVRPDPSAPPSA